MKITVTSVILIFKPSEKLKKPKLTCTVENPTFKALKKKAFTGPFGKTLLNKNDSAEPMIPPITIPKITFPNFLFAIPPPFCLRQKHGYSQILTRIHTDYKTCSCFVIRIR